METADGVLLHRGLNFRNEVILREGEAAVFAAEASQMCPGAAAEAAPTVFIKFRLLSDVNFSLSFP